MLSRAFAVAGAVAVLGTMVLATPDKPVVKVGDMIEVQLTGDLAQQFAERTVPPEAGKLPEGLQVQFLGVVEQTFSDGRFRIEHSSQITREGKLHRLVTLTAVVDANQCATRVTPAGTATFSSPEDANREAQPALTTEASEMLTLQLSDLKGVKLRTWTLAEELGE
jgi:hypothetical protein